MSTWPRILIIALGIWLIVATFVWPHSTAEQTNAWVVGILAATFAVLAADRDELRYLDTALGVWLFASIWVLPSLRLASLWNSGIVAAGLFVFSLLPSLRTGTARPVGHTAHAEA